MNVKSPTRLAIVLGALLSSCAFAQIAPRFDMSGNVSFDGAKIAGAPSSNTQLNGIGWRSTGVSHFNRWLAATSQFSGSYATSNSMRLIGYSGPGKVQHYSMLAGPRINFASRSRFNPFIEGLAGVDRTSTKITGNGVVVTGQEFEVAYAAGGGAQIALSRRVALNFQADYFATEHSLLYTGWEPSRLQISTGLVFTLFGARDSRRVAEESRPSIPPPTRAIVEPAPSPAIDASIHASTVMPAPTNAIVTAAKPSPMPVPATSASADFRSQPQPSPAYATEIQVHTQRQPPSAIVATATAPSTSATAQPAMVGVVIVEGSQARQRPIQAVLQQPVSNPAASISRAPVSATPAAAVSYAPVTAPPAVARVQAQQAAPFSLGEYARRLREKKQQQQ
ncbi:MAG TPA: outer membrane beta-barrel protein [Terriglobales bacterium]|nr:outer membrane beta-barrel protein [Terriglobales bacterium]